MESVTVFGGSGFLGRRIVRHLAKGGHSVRVAVRRPEAVAPGDDAAPAGRIEAVRADIRDAAAVAAALDGAAGAVNAVSAYVEKAGVTYAAVHETGARIVAEACVRYGVAGLVHISGIGADATSPSRYVGARGRGEALVREAFPEATILRPSVMFGPDDAFLDTLADIARRAPVFVLVGGATRLQPVHVADVAEAVARVLREPAARGRVYELGGPRVWTLGEVVAAILGRLRLRRPMLPLPFAVARVAAAITELLPSPPLTVAQVELLQSDNVASAGLPGLADLGIEPRSLDDSLAELTMP